MLCTFEKFINITNYNSVNNYKNKIYLPSNYIKCKNDYDCYFKHSFILSIINENVKKVYRWINILILGFLLKGIIMHLEHLIVQIYI